jgi:hemerythrin-like metal-binding protein
MSAAQAPIIEWSERYAVGIRAIDGQHREMLELVNRLLEGLHASREQGELVETLRQLVRATEHNVATEERLMREYGLEADHHREEHRRLLASVRDFHLRLEPEAVAESSRFLRQWLLGHIEEDDRQFALQLRERGAR